MARLWQHEDAGATDIPEKAEEPGQTLSRAQEADEPASGALSRGQEFGTEGSFRAGDLHPAEISEEVPDGIHAAPGNKYLLIETNEESVRTGFVLGAETASQFAGDAAFVDRQVVVAVERILMVHSRIGCAGVGEQHAVDHDFF